MSEQKMPRLALSVPEFAEAIGVGRATVYDAIARGEISAVRIGRRVVIPARLVDEMLGAKAVT